MPTPIPLTEEEARLSYAKYYCKPLAPIPQEKLDILNGPPADPARAMKFKDRNLFLDKDYDYIENGFGTAEDGTAFMCNATFMPGVTSAMMDWWFGWHCVGPDLRYRIWDPEDHSYARADRPDYVLDPNVPWREKTWGVTHHICEDVGFGGPTEEELQIHFKRPRDVGLDESKIGGPGCTSLVCGVSRNALMIHKWYEEDGGIWVKSRFWPGYSFNEAGEPIRLIPEGMKIPPLVPKTLYGHNIREFTNLASFLPQLYAEEWNGQAG